MVFVFHHLLCFIKVQNLFIQFGLSFFWSLSGGETILSMYFQYAFLISLCVCRLSSLNLASSLLFLDCFFLLYHLSLFRIRRLISGVIHGLPSFFLAILLGIFTPMLFSSLVWKCAHIALTFDFWSFILIEMPTYRYFGRHFVFR